MGCNEGAELSNFDLGLALTGARLLERLLERLHKLRVNIARQKDRQIGLHWQKLRQN